MAAAHSWLSVYHARAGIVQADICMRRQAIEEAARLLQQHQPIVMADGTRGGLLRLEC